MSNKKKSSKFVIQSEEELIKTYNELARAESAVKQMRKAIRDYVEENGEFADEDADVRIDVVEREPVWTFDDMSKVYQMMKFDGIDPDKFFNITGTKATQLNKVWTEEEMKLAGGYLKPRSEQFRIRKF